MRIEHKLLVGKHERINCIGRLVMSRRIIKKIYVYMYTENRFPGLDRIRVVKGSVVSRF